jgi:hypothetical protein
MQDDPQHEIERLISEGQILLQNYQSELESLKSPGTDLGDTILSEFAGAVVSDALGSGHLGRKARSISRASLKTGRKKKIRELESKYLQSVNNWMSKVSGFLSDISTLTSSKRQNSQKLVSKFAKIESAVRPDTKLRNGIGILKEFALQGVVRNVDLPKSKPTGLVVKPGEQFKAYNRILEITSRAVGHLIIVDPYPSRETLIVVENSPRNQPVMLLTNPPQRNKERAEFEVLAKKLMKDRPKVNVRYAPRGTLHDRFILTETEAWLVGHSIKDIGNKLSMITPIGPDEAERIRKEIEALWSKAIPV